MEKLNDFCRQPPPRQIPPRLKKRLCARVRDYVSSYVEVSMLTAYGIIVIIFVGQFMAEFVELDVGSNSTIGVITDSVERGSQERSRFLVSFRFRDRYGIQHWNTSYCSETLRSGFEVPVEVSSRSWSNSSASRIRGCSRYAFSDVDPIFLVLQMAFIASYLLGSLKKAKSRRRNVKSIRAGNIVDGMVLSSWMSWKDEGKLFFIEVAFYDGTDRQTVTAKVKEEELSSFPNNTPVHVIYRPSHCDEALVLETLWLS